MRPKADADRQLHAVVELPGETIDRLNSSTVVPAVARFEVVGRAR